MNNLTYTSGEYFENAHRHSEDAEFKSANFTRIFGRFLSEYRMTFDSYADVGCGSGKTTIGIADTLKHLNCGIKTMRGYDISPHVTAIKGDGIDFLHADFSKTDDFADLVTLFDVFEHVPDPIGFIKSIAEKCNVLVFHIPLDYSLNTAFRDMFRAKLKVPGHLIFMDSAYALNLLTLSGLRVVDYEYTFAFLAPSGNRTLFNKLAFPLRYIISKISPWLLSKTLGGAGLMVIALTPRGVKAFGDGGRDREARANNEKR